MLKLFKSKKINIIRPAKGKIIKIEEVSDPVFSEKMLGDGFAIMLSEGIIKAPVGGKLVQIFPTNHAFGIRMENGLEVLVHIGIDTVALKGQGFRRIKEVDQDVKVGEPIIEVDLDFLKANGKDVVTPVVFTSVDKVKEISIKAESKSDIVAVVKAV